MPHDERSARDQGKRADVVQRISSDELRLDPMGFNETDNFLITAPKDKWEAPDVFALQEKMRKSLGNKRNFITDDQIQQITNIYTAFEESEDCKIFDNEDFGFTKVTVERPLIENEVVVKDKSGNPKPDSSSIPI